MSALQQSLSGNLASGKIKLDAGDIVGAVKDFSQELRVNPVSSKAFYFIGLARLKNKEFKNAVNCAEKSLKLNNTNIEAYILQGDALASEQEFDKAKASYQRALLLDKNNNSILQKLSALSQKKTETIDRGECESNDDHSSVDQKQKNKKIAESMIANNVGNEEIISSLVEAGCTEENAIVMVNGLLHLKERTRIKMANKDMMTGGLWIIMSILIIIISYSLAFEGWQLRLVWVAVIFGAVLFFRGLINRSR